MTSALILAAGAGTSSEQASLDTAASATQASRFLFGGFCDSLLGGVHRSLLGTHTCARLGVGRSDREDERVERIMVHEAALDPWSRGSVSKCSAVSTSPRGSVFSLCVCIYIYIYIYIYTHTHTHIYIHLFIWLHWIIVTACSMQILSWGPQDL